MDITELERATRIVRLMATRSMTQRAARIVVDAAMFGIGCTEGKIREQVEREKHFSHDHLPEGSS
jgi:hypothetical protein